MLQENCEFVSSAHLWSDSFLLRLVTKNMEGTRGENEKAKMIVLFAFEQSVYLLCNSAC